MQKLHLSESIVNNIVSTNTIFQPFYINRGSHVTNLVSLMASGKPNGSSKVAIETLELMNIALAETETRLERAQCKMTHVVNRSRG